MTPRAPSLLALAMLACTTTAEPPPPSDVPAGETPPSAFVEEQTAAGTRPASAGPPVEGLVYWARPSQTIEAFVDQAKAAGIEIRQTVEVGTTQELIAALAPQTLILLRPGRYVFDDSNLLGEDHEREALPDYSSLSPHYDDHRVHDLDDLMLVGLGPEPAVLIQPDSYAPALEFANVRDLALYNLAIGHRPEQGWCQGGVIRVIDGANLLIAGTTLFGSGTEGLSLVGVDGLTLVDSVITDCSEQFSTISGSRGIVYEHVEIVGNHGDLLRGFAIYRSAVTLVDTTIADNHELGWTSPDSYGELFAIDGDYDWGAWFVDDPRPVEPERRASEVVLRNTSIDGELFDRQL